MRISRTLEIVSAFVVIIVTAVDSIDSNANIFIRIVNSATRIYSRKEPGTTDSDWSSSNETVNYLSYSRHAGFVESWKTHVTCFIRTKNIAPCHFGFLCEWRHYSPSNC